MKARRILTIVILVIISLPVLSQRAPEILAVREIEIQDDKSEIAVQNAYKDLIKKFNWYFLGNSAFLGKGNRGERDDKYIFLWGFDVKEHRDYYYPPDSTVGTAPAREAWAKIGRSGYPYVKENPPYTDYRLIGFKKMIDPQIGEVVAIRYPEIIPAKEKEFLQKMENEWVKKCEELGSFFYIGDRGEKKGKYMHLLSINTYETYINHITPEGEFTKEGEKAFKPTKAFYDELKSYFKEGSFNTFTDYIIVR